MAIVYFDASALVKLLIKEAGADVAVALWNGCDAAVSSRLVYPEVCAAIASAHRDRRIDVDQQRRAVRQWDAYWSQLRVIELTAEVGRRAGLLVRAHALCGADGVHLASALVFAEADPVLACWDRRLAAGAAAEGLRIAPDA
jgi:uncharacterized protein